MDNLTFVKYGIMGTKSLINSILNIDNRKQILDPFSCIIRLALLSFKERGTKISVSNNKIYFQPPNILQGPVRWTYGDNRNDLHNLCNPIIKAIKWYSSNEDVRNIFIYTIKGLTKLKQSYIQKNMRTGDSNLVCHSISHYVGLIKECLNNNDMMQEDNETNQFKILWKETEIEIINNLLKLANEKKENSEEYIYIINAIESILEDKDECVNRILNGFPTTL